MPRDITRFRNIGIMAHVDAGKTTCAERILWLAGRIRTKGEVHDGNAAMDFHPLEQKKGITIQAAATRVSWTPKSGPFAEQAHVVSLVDTPGHVDFTIEVERSLRVLDGAVFVLDAASGVECQSETVFRQARRLGVPCLAFVNKIDKVGADFEACLNELASKLGADVAPVQWPWRDESGIGIVDILEQRLVVESDGGRTRTLAPVPEPLKDTVWRWRRRLLEIGAEVDESLMGAFCMGDDVGADELARALRTATTMRDSRVLVVTCGSALGDKGVGPLLDAVVSYLPSPSDRPPVTGTDPRRGVVVARFARSEDALAALAFKTSHDPMAGLVTWLRIYSGTLRAGEPALVVGQGPRERGEKVRIGRVFLPDVDARREVGEAEAGDIVCVTGLSDVRTGESLVDMKAPVALEAIVVPEPVVSLSLEPKSSADRDKLGPALARLLACDPSLRASVETETGQTLLSGMGMLHLEIAVTLLETEHGVGLRTGQPHVAYRETIASEVAMAYRHKKQNGGVGQFAGVSFVVRPGERGSGIVFVDETKGGVVPKELVPAIERGVRMAAERGIDMASSSTAVVSATESPESRGPHPLVDLVVRLVDGETHPKESSALAFELAGSLALREAVRKAGVALLEPVALIEVVAPEAHTGDVVGDLAARRGIVRAITVHHARGEVVVTARVPLANTFDLVPRLRTLTHGRGGASLRPDGYDVAPRDVRVMKSAVNG